MIDEEYSEYAKLKSKISDAQKVLASDKRMCERLERFISDNDKSGEYAIKISSHAFDQIAERLEEVTNKSSAAYKDIEECDPDKSLNKPSNLKVFIITMICKSRSDGSFKRKKSKSGFEFVYNVEISKWSTDKNLFFTCIVENGVVKTGYFNFIGG